MTSVTRFSNRTSGSQDRREHAELVGRVRLLVEVLLVGEPREDRTDDGSEQLRAGGDGELREVDLVGDQEADTDGGVQDGSGVGRGEDTHEDRETPSPVDHQEAAAEALVLRERDVCDHTTSEEDQQRSADELRQEVETEIHFSHVFIDLS